MSTPRLLFVAGLLLLLIPFMPARGYTAMPQASYLGTVTARDLATHLITIHTDACRWTIGVGDWSPCDSLLQAEAPNSDAILGIQVGDRVEASAMGEPGIVTSGWVSLARLKHGAEERITVAYGDIGCLFSTLEGSYSVDYANAPDCPTCMGCWCEATHAHVELAGEFGPLDAFDLEPGEDHLHYGAPYCFYIAFHSGEANGYPTCVGQPCAGPQLVSDFTLRIMDCGDPGWAPGAAQASLCDSGACSTGSPGLNVFGMLLFSSAYCAILLLKKRSRASGPPHS